MTIDPKTLNAEERAIVDRCAFEFWLSEPRPRERYELAMQQCEEVILARRAIYASPAHPGPQREEKVYQTCPHCLGKTLDHTCPNCRASVPWEDHHLDPCGWVCEMFYPGKKFATPPAPPPAPVAGELAEAVLRAMGRLAYCASSPHETDDWMEETLAIRTNLESWARSQAEETGKLKAKVKALSTLSAGLEVQLDEARSQATAQPVAVGISREYRMVEDAAAARGLWHLDNGQRRQFEEITDAIAAVRDQAASAQPQPPVRDLGKVREFFDSISGLQFPNARTHQRYLAALAELDASAQPKAVEVPVDCVRALLNYADAHGIVAKDSRDAVRRWLAAAEGGK